MRTAIIIPAYNEEQSIAEVIAGIRSQSADEIIVVNDASEDKTEEIALGSGATVINLCTNLGAWGAMQAGIRYAREKGYKEVLTMDADGQHLPETIALLKKTTPEADVVIGSCVSRASSLRKIAWHYFRLVANLPIEDLTSGLRLYRGQALDVLIARRATLLDYQDVGLLLLLRAEGLNIVEVNVPMALRVGGKSRIFSSWLRVLSYMATTSLICISKMLQYKRKGKKVVNG